MIDKKKDISFAEFYLIEFFNLTLSKGVDAIPEENFSILKELSDYLLEEDNVIENWHNTREQVNLPFFFSI